MPHYRHPYCYRIGQPHLLKKSVKPHLIASNCSKSICQRTNQSMRTFGGDAETMALKRCVWPLTPSSWAKETTMSVLDSSFQPTSIWLTLLLTKQKATKMLSSRISNQPWLSTLLITRTTTSIGQSSLTSRESLNFLFSPKESCATRMQFLQSSMEQTVFLSPVMVPDNLTPLLQPFKFCLQ